LKDKEELAGGEGVGFECAFDNPDEIGEEGRAGGGPGTLQLSANVERKNTTGFLLKEIGGEGVVWNGRDQSREDGIRSRRIVIIERLFFKFPKGVDEDFIFKNYCE
jgi:hypothetical protein